jgi:hypothetical protein
VVLVAVVELIVALVELRQHHLLDRVLRAAMATMRLLVHILVAVVVVLVVLVLLA